jgi:hypothetical protein
MRTERVVPCRPEQFWWALIQSAEPSDTGVVLRCSLTGDGLEISARITRYESMRLLECRQDGHLLRWEIEPCDQGCTRVVFTESTESPSWLAFLDRIAHEATSSKLSARPADDCWPRDAATPPPPRTCWR